MKTCWCTHSWQLCLSQRQNHRQQMSIVPKTFLHLCLVPPTWVIKDVNLTAFTVSLSAHYQTWWWQIVLTFSMEILHNQSPASTLSKSLTKLRRLSLMPATCKFMKHFLVECLVFVWWSHGQEDVSPNKLVDGFARTLHGGKGDFVRLKVEDDIFHLPVDVPRLQRGVAPGLQRVSRVELHADDAVLSDTHQFLRVAKWKRYTL